MKCITVKNAVMVFCYLLHVDGEITEQESEKLDEIGMELDKYHFLDYKDELLEVCQAQLRSVIDKEDSYDVLAEGVDKALYAPAADDDEVVASRFLVWNLLTLAYGDDIYHHDERRLIKHIVRVCGIPRDVFLEMEQLMRSAIEVTRERELLSESDRPYREIVPIMAQVEKRIENIAMAAKNLIEDEVNEPSLEELKMDPTLYETISEATAPVASGIKDAAEKTGAAVSGFFGGIGKMFTGNKQTESSEKKTDSAEA